tara:strand:- start:41 stop:679 length:639 start_codon:yes stop_codon:yes gene_type:complete
MYISFLKGVGIGLVAYGIGFIMDITISKKSFLDVIEDAPMLYQKALYQLQINMLLIWPVIYTFTDAYLFDHTNNEINIKKILTILTIHSVGNYFTHIAMHKIQWLKKYHDFHHEFDKYIMPSIGNAVSTEEFLLAYIMPYMIGAYVVRPNEINFVIPVALITVYNNIIHCIELENIPWCKYIVSPKQHIVHHETHNKHYAVPIFKIDYLLEE